MKLPLVLFLAFAFMASPALAQRAADTGAGEQPAPQVATILLNGADGQQKGTALLTPVPKGVLVRVEVEGLSPGWHGVHFHGTGTCADHDQGFKASGTHAARLGETHGFLTEGGPHMGDLPNLYVAADGIGKAEFFTPFLTEAELRDKDGSALMIHAQADDYKSEPAGNAGDRIACGVVEAQ